MYTIPKPPSTARFRHVLAHTVLVFGGLLLCLDSALQAAKNATTTTFLSLGKINVDSYLKQTLDVQVKVFGVPADRMLDLRLLKSSQRAYREAGQTYLTLHNRLVSELVVNDGDPYVAISSVGPVGMADFSVVLVFEVNGTQMTRAVGIHLDPQPTALQPNEQPLSSAEVQNELFHILALALQVQPSIVLEEIRKRVQKDPSGSTDKSRGNIPSLRDYRFDARWVKGFEFHFLPLEMHSTFTKVKLEYGVSQAIQWVLFGNGGRRILRQLLSASLPEAMGRAGSLPKQVKQLTKRMAALENLLIHLEARTRDRDTLPKTSAPDAFENNWFLDIWSYEDWRFFFTQPFWILVAVLLLIVWFSHLVVFIKRAARIIGKKQGTTAGGSKLKAHSNHDQQKVSPYLFADDLHPNPLNKPGNH